VDAHPGRRDHFSRSPRGTGRNPARLLNSRHDPSGRYHPPPASAQTSVGSAGTMRALRRLSSLRNAAAVPRLLARAAPPPPVRCYRLSTGAPSRPPPPQTPKDTSKMRVSSGSLGYEADARPDAETVKRLGENAKVQAAVWQVWVPEAGIRFGDRCVLLPPSNSTVFQSAAASRAHPRRVLVAGSFGSC
jgi:hypothetical protein